jgi:PAS domain S-box-containing protein
MQTEIREPRSVLVVEDERIVARDIAESLVSMGYVVVGTASTAEEAIDKVAAHAPDLVLMDIRIEGERDGIDAAIALRERFDVPVVFLTAYADDATVRRACEVEPHGYLVKPFRESELRSVIEVALYKHRMEDRVKSRERWFSTTLRAIADAVVAVDDDEDVRFLNVAAESLLGVSSENAAGRRLSEVLQLVDERTREPVSNRVRAALEGNRPGTERILLVGPSGERSVEDHIAPIVDDRGDLLGAVIVFRDVSEQRRLERQVVLSDRLASLGTLAAGVAHEINNPLMYMMSNGATALDEIAGVARAVRAGWSGPEASAVVSRLEAALQTLAEVRQGTEQVKAIVADLRLFARSDEMEAGGVDPLVAVEWALRVTANELQHRAVLKRSLSPVPNVDTTPTRLGQVLVNLLVNASQAIQGRMEDNEIEVSTAVGSDGQVVISVRDTGAGIDPALHDRIFDPFFTTRPVGAGTGLGLSVVHGIVTALGGRITVERNADRGSTFRVHLPPAKAPRAVPKRAATPTDRRRARILVVDDEPLVLRSLERVLGREHEVVATTQPFEALRILESDRSFDLVLCDLMMPGRTGMDIYEELRKSAPEITERMVFLTGGAFTPRAVEFVGSIPNRIVDKPISPTELLGLLQELLAAADDKGPATR